MTGFALGGCSYGRTTSRCWIEGDKKVQEALVKETNRMKQIILRKHLRKVESWYKGCWENAKDYE